MCIGSLFPVSPAFVNAETTLKWYVALYSGIVFTTVYILFSFFTRNTKKESGIMISGFSAVVVVACTVQALYGIAQYVGILSVGNGFQVTGSFDNPAGFAASLCAGFPFLFVFLFNQKTWIKGLSIAAGLIVITAVVLSASRAGIISLFAIGLLILFQKLRIKTIRKVLVFAIALVLTLPGLYFLKKDSADGRLLIWCCSWEMIKDKPLLGHGTGGFKANYMNYQAAYFEENPESKFALLADNVARPFNEYLLLATNYGLVGLGVFFFFLWFLWKSYRRIQDKNKLVTVSVCSLLSIAVFALFSYPLRYPFVWVAGALSTVVIISRAEYKTRISPAVSLSLKVGLIPVLVVLAVTTYSTMSAEIKWNRTARKSLMGQTEEMLPAYKQLYSKLHRNELFLYNYAAELNVVEHYEESLQIAKECGHLWADYDLQMLMAENCQQLQQYAEAERYYRRAAAMCPVKFMPLYRLAELYQAAGQSVEARKTAEKIVEKKIKIPSPTINAIKSKMRDLISEQDSTNVPVPESRISEKPDNNAQFGRGNLSENSIPKGGLQPP